MGKLIKLLVAIGLLSGGVLALFKGFMELEKEIPEEPKDEEKDSSEETVSYKIEEVLEKETKSKE